MLHAKCHDYRAFTPEEENFKSFFLTTYSLGGQLDHVTFTIYLNFRLPFPGRLFKILALLSQTGSEERISENGRRRRTSGELETALSLIIIPLNKLTYE